MFILNIMYKLIKIIPKRNGHYITCVWANPENIEGPGTCGCFKQNLPELKIIKR